MYFLAFQDKNKQNFQTSLSICFQLISVQNFV
ncbi:hypothetical protein CCA_00798 [Chlamydia caviae GPIC]|uniref:Uncharacterized protein n=1 Tax=Chlamydia caviae (strain ATCC VR-813 / DSM 19441 / 03DC25 / GPIC) TaxID=227941 RepID=Q821Y7_CHLCV|nr:hypothetical protein CCA_00798 [Chlamydia caviae GPIC]